jgi:hypothetical protein
MPAPPPLLLLLLLLLLMVTWRRAMPLRIASDKRRVMATIPQRNPRKRRRF